MQAIILAAGKGERLKPFTDTRPKCLIELGRRPLLEYQIRSLHLNDITNISIVVGYLADQITPFKAPLIHNTRFATTNMVASLMCARALLTAGEDILIAYGDIVYEPGVLNKFLTSPAPISVAINTGWRALWEARFKEPLFDLETLRIDSDGLISEIGNTPESYDDIGGQYMGLILIRSRAAKKVVGYYDNLRARFSDNPTFCDTLQMTRFLQLLIESGHPISGVQIPGGWLEVDSIDDIRLYESMRQAGTLDSFCSLDAFEAK